jgi:hypothetical protein
MPFAELGLRTLRAVDDHLARFIEVVATEIGTPALIVGRKPARLALRTSGD